MTILPLSINKQDKKVILFPVYYSIYMFYQENVFYITNKSNNGFIGMKRRERTTGCSCHTCDTKVDSGKHNTKPQQLLIRYYQSQ